MKYIPDLASKVGSNHHSKNHAHFSNETGERIDVLFPALFVTFIWIVGNLFTGRSEFLLETSLIGYSAILTLTVIFKH